MNAGLCALASAIAVGFGCLSAIGEGLICSHAMDGMVRNPEMADKLRTNMMVAVALDESTAIYALVVSLLILFMMGLPALSAGK